MTDLSRRLFLGAAGAAGAVAVAGSALDSPGPVPRDAERAGPIVARVRDVRSGEVTVYVGTHEVRRHDPALAAALARAAAAR